MTYLDSQQVDLLLKPIHPKRVLSRLGMAYVEAHDIKAELIRVLGFANFSSEVIEQDLLFETQVTMSNDKPGWNVAYRSRVRLTVKAKDGTELAIYTEGHVGDSTHPVRSEAHGNALTNSESYALKRCAVFLGDQFGLSLYNKGSKDAIVRWTLFRPPALDEEETTEDRDTPEVKPESLEADPTAETRTTSSPSTGNAPDRGVSQPVDGAKQALAESIKDRLEAGPLDFSPKTWLTQILKEAAAEKVLHMQVDDGAGGTVALKVLIERAAKMVTGP